MLSGDLAQKFGDLLYLHRVSSQMTAMIGRYVDKGMQMGLDLNQIWPRPSMSIHQNRVCIFGTSGAKAAQTRCRLHQMSDKSVCLQIA